MVGMNSDLIRKEELQSKKSLPSSEIVSTKAVMPEQVMVRIKLKWMKFQITIHLGIIFNLK